jgi:hypothetical protein
MIEEYKNLLKALDMLFTATFINDIDKLSELEVKEKIKQVVSIIEHWTNLDLYNHFSDLYDE